jgi:hypothetical protein
MGAFDDLIPSEGGRAAGRAPPKSAGAFDDLVGGGKKPPSRRGGKPSSVRKGVMGDLLGGAVNLYESIPLMDEGAAALDTGVRLMTGQAQDVGEAWRQSREMQSENAADFKARRPTTTAVLKGTGAGASMLIPGGQGAGVMMQGGRAANMARGALMAAGTGYLYGATDKGTLAERGRAGTEAATNPMVLAAGAAGGALAPVAPKARPRDHAAATRKADAAILKDLGVETTIPQRMGGMAKQTEDLAMRAPILGPAISGARARQVEQLNRGIALKALAPVGKTVPADIKPGFEMVEFVDDALGQVYDDAAKLAPRVQLDEQLASEAAEIGARRVDLSEAEARQFDSIVRDRLSRLQSGEASGQMVKKIHGELGQLQAEATRKGQTTLAGMLGDTRRAMLGLIERANPQAGEMIRQADEGWQVYSMMNDAAAQATNRGGVFLPGQFNTQVRGAARRIGSNMAGKGKGPLQDVATAATRMLPDQFGNPGTANAVGLGGLMVGLGTEPTSTVLTAGGLAAAATPYWRLARSILEELPVEASPAQLAAADAQLARLAVSDPAVAALRREVAARLGAAAGAGGAMMLAPSNASARE